MENVIYLEYPENDYRNYLEHHGIPGMRWGVRRYQNRDGTLTAAGRRHVKGQDSGNSGSSKSNRANSNTGASKGSRMDAVKEKLSDPKTQRALKIAAAVGATALTAYAVSKGSEAIRKAAARRVTEIELNKSFEELKRSQKSYNLLKYAMNAGYDKDITNGIRNQMDRQLAESRRLGSVAHYKNVKTNLNAGFSPYIALKDGKRMGIKDKAISTKRSIEYLYNNRRYLNRRFNPNALVIR